MLELKKISKTFNPGTVNEKCALHELSLSVPDGDFITIIGANGAQKSTLFGAISGSFLTDSGEILLDGQDVNGGEGVKDPACLAMTTESLTREFPLYTPSLLNLVKTSETHVKGLSPQE